MIPKIEPGLEKTLTDLKKFENVTLAFLGRKKAISNELYELMFSNEPDIESIRLEEKSSLQYCLQLIFEETKHEQHFENELDQLYKACIRINKIIRKFDSIDDKTKEFVTNLTYDFGYSLCMLVDLSKDRKRYIKKQINSLYEE